MFASISSDISLVFLSFRELFSSPTFTIFCQLATGALLNRGRQTITSMLRTLPLAVRRDVSRYHRFFSSPRWSLTAAARILTGLVIGLLPDGAAIQLAVDDTTMPRHGHHVFARSFHRDAIRSTRKKPRFCHGHKWLVISVLVPLPGIRRPWALPILVYLVRPVEHPKHRKPIELAMSGLRLLKRWHPDRHVTITGDRGFAAHYFARFCKHNGITLVSRFYPHAALHEAPKPNAGRGRPRIKGKRLTTPADCAADPDAGWIHIDIRWYGGQILPVQLLTGTGHWYRKANGIVHVRWVILRRPGHDDEIFYTTDTDMQPKDVIEAFIGRWSIEVSFEEIRRHLHVHLNEVWSKASVTRLVPCLFGLFSLSVVAMHTRICNGSIQPGCDPWYPKKELTYADVIRELRQQLLIDTYFSHTQFRQGMDKNAISILNPLLRLATQSE